MRCTSQFEEAARREGFTRIAGVDEAGRGCLFGPVFAAAVILHPDRPIRGLADSKTLDEQRRQELAPLIRQRAVAWAVGIATAEEIDRVNIRQASRLAMRRAVESLNPNCDYLLVDALTIDWPVPNKPSSRAMPAFAPSPPPPSSPKSPATPASLNSIASSPATASPATKATRPPRTP